MKILTIETTCDETAAAVVTDELEVLSSVVASQDELHRRFAGVVPEIAARAHVERILPVIDEALSRANVQLDDLDAIAVANTPGLAGSLLVGLVAAKTLCVAAGKPLVAINHLHAHIYACRMAAGRDVFPCVGLIVSGGHTSLYRCAGPTDFEYLGGTIDDAAGEAFDKVAGHARACPIPAARPFPKRPSGAIRGPIDFPRGLANDRRRLDFSFSGLKTAVRYAIAGPQNADLSQVKLDRAANRRPGRQLSGSGRRLPGRQDRCSRSNERGCKRLCVGGGVAANRLLRERLAAESRRAGFELHIAPPELCTDNAVMGAIAFERLKAGKTEPLDLDAIPGLVRH